MDQVPSKKNKDGIKSHPLAKSRRTDRTPTRSLTDDRVGHNSSRCSASASAQSHQRPQSESASAASAAIGHLPLADPPTQCVMMDMADDVATPNKAVKRKYRTEVFRQKIRKKELCTLVANFNPDLPDDTDLGRVRLLTMQVLEHDSREAAQGPDGR